MSPITAPVTRVAGQTDKPPASASFTGGLSSRTGRGAPRALSLAEGLLLPAWGSEPFGQGPSASFCSGPLDSVVGPVPSGQSGIFGVRPRICEGLHHLHRPAHAFGQLCVADSVWGVETHCDRRGGRPRCLGCMSSHRQSRRASEESCGAGRRLAKGPGGAEGTPIGLVEEGIGKEQGGAEPPAKLRRVGPKAEIMG